MPAPCLAWADCVGGHLSPVSCCRSESNECSTESTLAVPVLSGFKMLAVAGLAPGCQICKSLESIGTKGVSHTHRSTPRRIFRRGVLATRLHMAGNSCYSAEHAIGRALSQMVSWLR